MSPLAVLRRVLRLRVLSAAILALVVHWFALSTSAGRMPGGWYLVAVTGGLALFAVSVLRVVHRAATTALPPALRPLAPHAEIFMLLTALNLVILSPLAPLFELIAAGMANNPVHNPVVRQAFEAAGNLTGRALTFLFAAGVVAAAWVLLVRLFARGLRRSAATRRIGAALDALLVSVLALFCALSMALIYNANLDGGPAAPRRGDLVAISGLPIPFTGAVVGWADVRYLDAADRTERLILWPNEEVWPGRAAPGLPVRVDVRPGFLGIPWVQTVSIDHERDLRRALAAVPTAANLRMSLILMLAAERRWDEVSAETEAHVRAYPEDRRFVLIVSRDLRAHGQHALAVRLEDLGQQP